jgi:hypothetical protein
MFVAFNSFYFAFTLYANFIRRQGVLRRYEAANSKVLCDLVDCDNSKVKVADGSHGEDESCYVAFSDGHAAILVDGEK